MFTLSSIWGHTVNTKINKKIELRNNSPRKKIIYLKNKILPQHTIKFYYFLGFFMDSGSLFHCRMASLYGAFCPAAGLLDCCCFRARNFKCEA